MTLKERLHAHLLGLLQTQLNNLHTLHQQLSQESTETGKGSAGDKHEVGIAMAQIELEKLAKQVQLIEQQLVQLKRLDPALPCTQIQMGALWQSAGRLYYAAVAVGQLEFEGKAVFCLSAEAPVFQALRLKKQHDNVLFNGSTWLIESVD